jgi:aminomethyltransferase
MSGINKILNPTSISTSYDVAHNKAVVVDRSDLGMLKITGKTRLDLINRMSTQKVDALENGEGAATILTTEVGRIIDRLILYASSDTVYCLTGENNAQSIADYLKRFVFYMDDFHVEDVSDNTAILAIYGRRAALSLADLFGEAVQLDLHQWREVELGQTNVYLHKTDPVTGDGYFLMGAEVNKAAMVEGLIANGIPMIDEETFEYLRIESGQPRFGHEISQEYIPLEANLWSDVSFNKGCYTGQEIIARMESRGRLAKKLVRLKADEPLGVGRELSFDGKKAGIITSESTGPNGLLALGYVKTKALPTSLNENEPIIFQAGTVPVALDSLL